MIVTIGGGFLVFGIHGDPLREGKLLPGALLLAAPLCFLFSTADFIDDERVEHGSRPPFHCSRSHPGELRDCLVPSSLQALRHTLTIPPGSFGSSSCRTRTLFFG
jgi:hypothetical protein